MNRSRLNSVIASSLVIGLASLSLLLGCKPKSNEMPVTPEIGHKFPSLATAVAKGRDIPETEYIPYLFLRGCGDEAIANVQPYLDVLAGAPIQIFMTEECHPELSHFFYLRDNLSKQTVAVQGSGTQASAEMKEHYFINGQTTLYVGKDGMISYIHTADQPFEFKTWDELIAHIESQ